MKTKNYFIILIIIIAGFSGCKKDWLEKKRDISKIVPTTLADMRLLMNGDVPLARESKFMLEIWSDEYACSDSEIDALSDIFRLAYLRQRQAYELQNSISTDWNNAYRSVLVANVVLEGLEKIMPSNSELAEYNDIKGNALFIRARSFFNLTETFAKPYNVASASTDLGIPLQLHSDINTPIVRATIQETWDRITADLKEAAYLLKPLPSVTTNGSRWSAYALLARVFLCQQNYGEALKYSDLALQIKGDLLNYNTLNAANTYPITRFNTEVVTYSEAGQINQTLMTVLSRTDRDIYNLYDINDLRRSLFFVAIGTTDFGFRGSYSGNVYVFTGFATDEMYLTRAECNARLGNTQPAMDDINKLLMNRYRTGTFTNLTAANPHQALEIALRERRKQILRRGIRWHDIRRLNNDPQFAKILQRTYKGTNYTLTPEQIKHFYAEVPTNAQF